MAESIVYVTKTLHIFTEDLLTVWFFKIRILDSEILQRCVSFVFISVSKNDLIIQNVWINFNFWCVNLFTTFHGASYVSILYVGDGYYSNIIIFTMQLMRMRFVFDKNEFNHINLPCLL